MTIAVNLPYLLVEGVFALVTVLFAFVALVRVSKRVRYGNLVRLDSGIVRVTEFLDVESDGDAYMIKPTTAFPVVVKSSDGMCAVVVREDGVDAGTLFHAFVDVGSEEGRLRVFWIAGPVKSQVKSKVSSPGAADRITTLRVAVGVRAQVVRYTFGVVLCLAYLGISMERIVDDGKLAISGGS